MTVIFIALLHSVPVFLIGAIWLDSKGAAIVAAMISGVIAVSTGNPAFASADLVGIALATWASVAVINNPSASVAARRLLEVNLKRAQLLERERHLSIELHNKFYSPEAARRRGSKQRTSAVVLGVLLLLGIACFSLTDALRGPSEMTVALICGGCAVALAWGLINFDSGRFELEQELRKIRLDLQRLDR